MNQEEDTEKSEYRDDQNISHFDIAQGEKEYESVNDPSTRIVYSSYTSPSLFQDPKGWFQYKKSRIQEEFKNFTDPNYKPNGGLFQGKNDGHCCNKKLTAKQQIFLGSFLNFLIFYIFVILMEHTCDKELSDYCMDYILVRLQKWLFLVIIISFLVVYTFLLGVKRVIPRYFLIYEFLIVIYICFLHFPLDLKKTTVVFYGPAQAIFAFIFIVLGFTFYGIGRCLKFLWKRFRFVIYGIFGLIIMAIIWYINKATGSCDGWEKGLTGELDFNGPYCKIRKPTVCYSHIFDNWLNFGPSTCQVQEKDKKQLKQDVLEKYQIITEKQETQKQKDEFVNDSKYDFLAQPLTTQFTYRERIFDVIQQNIISQSTPFQNLEEAQQNSEIVVGTKDYSYNIKVKRNEDLVKKRKEEVEKSGKKIESLAKNVIVVYVDTVSRAQAHRKLPKSMEFLRKFNGVDKKQEKQIYEFYRFHSIDKMTKDNALVLHFDDMYEDYQADPQKYEKQYSENPKFNLMKHFKEAGFIVGHSMNTCTSCCLFRTQYQDMRPFFLEEPADHEMTMWDPSYINPKNYYDMQGGPNSAKRRCLYGDDTCSYVFDYGYQFLREYKDEKKFLYMEFTDSHEITSEVVQYLDDHFLDFLQKSEKEKMFDEDTVVFIMSDHGQHIIQTFYIVEKPVKPDDWENAKKDKSKVYSNNFYQVERMLPLYQMIFSKNILNKIPNLPEVLKKNEQIMFGFREVRSTLLTLAYGFDEKLYTNNILKPLKEDADCRDLKMRPILHHEQFCICRPDFQ